jgi:hypothetical protein
VEGTPRRVDSGVGTARGQVWGHRGLCCLWGLVMCVGWQKGRAGMGGGMCMCVWGGGGATSRR